MGWIKLNKLLLAAAFWYTFMWSWSMQTDSLDLTGDKKQGLVIAIIVMAINIGISLSIMNYFFRRAQGFLVNMNQAVGVLLLIPFFALADYLVAWLMALFWIGPQAQWDSILPIGSAAFLVLGTPLIFAARIVGYFGLAGFAWTAIFLAFQQKHRKWAALPVGILLLTSLVGFAVFSSRPSPTHQAKLVSETLTERVPTIKPNREKLILFPEYGLEKITNDNLKDRIQMNSKLAPTFFAGSEQVYKQNRYGHENRILYGNTRAGITSFQDKYRLIPGGEDAPYLMRVALRATGQVSVLNYFSYAKAVIKGKDQLKVWSVGDDVRVGLAVCSSIIAPQDYRHFTQNGATVLANSASLKPFGGSRLFAWIQQSMGRFMAVANNRYFLQSANSASAYAYDNNGNLLGQKYGITTLPINFAAIRARTLYTVVGEWMVWLGLAVYGWLVLRRIKKPLLRKIPCLFK